MKARRLSKIIILAAATCIAAGCASDEARKAELKSGYTALEQKQYDSALIRANRVIAQPAGNGTPEAYYLRGRGIEDREKADDAAAAADLQEAQSAYRTALQHSPSPQLEGKIRAQLGEIAYRREDYETAVQEFAEAIKKPLDPRDEPWIRYRLGLCLQRLGKFHEADAAFSEVQKRFAETEPARRAAAHAGATGFYVQIGAFESSRNSDMAFMNLRRKGLSPYRAKDAQGRVTVRAGPVANYREAKKWKDRLQAEYPDAIIVP